MLPGVGGMSPNLTFSVYSDKKFLLTGVLSQISSSDNMIIGVNMKREIFYRSGINPGINDFGTHWERIEGELTQVVVGDGKIMGINDNLVYYRAGISEEEEYGTHWNSTGWHASYMSISKNLIVIIRDHEVMLRVGINKTSPLGTKWIRLEGTPLVQKVCF